MSDTKYSESNQNTSDASNTSGNTGNTFQGQNKQDASSKAHGCGCGYKAAPADEDLVEVEEEDIVY